MTRALLSLFLCAAAASAEEHRATFQKVDTEKRSLEVLISGATKTYPLAADVKLLGLARVPLKDGLRSKLLARPGVFVLVKTAPRDGREVVVEIELLRRGASPVRPDPP